MRMVMENAGLAFWPVVSLVIFFLACLAVILWVYRPGSREFYRRLGRKPLEDNPPGSSSDSDTRRKPEN